MLIIVGGTMSSQSYGQMFNFRELSVQQGLPQSEAVAILFDSKNIAWIGTQGGGLTIYDGSEMRTLTKNDSLISNRIYCLAEINKEIWVGQKGGVSKLDLNGKVLRNFKLADRNTIVQDIVDYQDQLLLACNNGVWELKAGEFSLVTDNPNLKAVNSESFFREDDQNLWVCTHEGLLHFTDYTKKLNNERGLRGRRVDCASTFHGIKVIGSYDGGLNLYDQKEGFVWMDQMDPLKECIITCLFVAKNDELWIGTENSGVFVYNWGTRELRNYTLQNGLSSNNVQQIVADYWDNIWIGTRGGGVSIFQNSPFIKYSTVSGLNSNYIFSVLSTSEGDLWVGTEGTGVVRITDTSSVLFDEEFGFHSSKVKALYEDRSGRIWIGTDGEGLGIYLPYDGKDTIYTAKKETGLQANWIKGFTEDKRGNLYLATSDGGIVRAIDAKGTPEAIQFARLRVDNGTIPERLSDIEYIDDRLWYASPNGFFGFVKDRKMFGFYTPDMTYNNVAGKGVNYWFGTRDNGLFHITLENDSIAAEEWITAEDYLSSNNIYQLVLRDNELWVGTEKGLDRLKLDSAFRVTGKEHFGVEEGFEGKEANLNAVFMDANNHLWFGTVNGLYHYQGGEVNYAQRKPPILRMEDFQISYQSIRETEFADYYQDGKLIRPLLLPYDKNDIQFSFKAIHYAYSNNIRYSWILEGVDPDWTPASKVTAATYSNLSPGDYAFKVKASIDDNWEVEPIILEFTIDQPYWEKTWFKASYYSAAIFLLLVIILIIVFRVRRKNKAIRERLELEKNMIELEQKALRLQMNPHFIFNVLNSIHNLIILNDPDKARYALAKFSKLMRRVLENSREKYISIDDEIETLENYVQLEKLTTGTDVSLDFEIDTELDTVEEILPPLMIQPFIENALIHGLKELDRPGQIKVSFKLLHEHLLEVTIEDNGRGRKNAAAINAQKESYHKSTALQVTQERLASMNPNPDFVPFEILDLTNSHGNPIGTRVVFRLEI